MSKLATPPKPARTPGPWGLNRCADMIEADGIGQVLALVPHGAVLPEETRRANAAFIVQACNAHDSLVARVAALEEALRGLLRAVDPAPNDKHFKLESFYVEPVKKARVALARSEGEV